MLGDELKRLRKQKKISQFELAEAIEMSQATIASWENGTRKPDIEAIKKLAFYFGITTDELLGIVQTDNMTDEERDLWELREQVRRDPERHILFSLAKNADINEVRQAVAIIDALKKTSGGGNNDSAR